MKNRFRNAAHQLVRFMATIVFVVANLTIFGMNRWGGEAVTPMAPNTALCLVLVSLCLLLLTLNGNGAHYEPPSTGGRVIEP